MRVETLRVPEGGLLVDFFFFLFFFWWMSEAVKLTLSLGRLGDRLGGG